jgi:hypothetical protein
MDKAFKISGLIAKKIKGEITSGEQDVLNTWLENDDNKKLYERILNDQNVLEKLDVYSMFDDRKAWKRIQDQLGDKKSVRLVPTVLLRYAAILVPIIMVTIATIYFIRQDNRVEANLINEQFKPGSQKAILVLADSTSVQLHEDNALQEIKQGGISILNDLKSLTYRRPDSAPQMESLGYNELITPNGGRYQVTLSDGTVAVLNADSRLRFPVDFTGETRQVFLSGEAYFEVQHDGRPFFVGCDGMNVEVLGTTFNVSSYEDDVDIRTTLVEGKVRVFSESTPENDRILAPADQAVFTKETASIDVMEVNTSIYTSWVDGKLEFSKENLENVMKVLSRWYDFDYKFENEDAKYFHFSARLSNDQEISTILDMLEMTTNVKFELEERTIMIY